jgi:CRP/FNR family transcriptional regulator
MQDIILKNALYTTIPKGMELFSQGYICKNILFLTKGYVKVFRRHISGQEITLYFLEEFEQCNVNLNSVLTNTPAIGTAITQSEVEGFMIPPNIVRDMYIQEEAYQNYVFNLYAKRLETLASLIEEIRFETLDDRVIKWLKENAINKIVKITHEELASHLGTSREVISRLLKSIEKHGDLELKRGEIIIKKEY